MTTHTFVILAYKESPHLEDCIKSLVVQKNKSKIIIATTADNKYIRGLAKKYELEVKVGEHTNIGGDFDFAVNSGDTELVTVAHQDDIYEPDYSEKITKAYEKSPNSVIIFSDYYEIRNGKKVFSNTNLKIKRILLHDFYIKKSVKSKFFKRNALRFGNAICCPAVTFVKKKCPKEIFTSDFVCNVDWHAWEKLSKVDGDFTFVPEKLMGHRISEESTTTDIIKQGIRTKEDLEIFLRFWPRWIAKFFTKIYKLSERSNKLS